MPRIRHEPTRTCVACRQATGKGALARLHRDVDGLIRLDPTGRAPGRGAYLHTAAGCALLARRRRALERSLKGQLSQELVAWLAQVEVAEA